MYASSPLFQGRTGCGGRPSGWHDIVTCQHLVYVASFSLGSRDIIALINFTVLLCIIFMHMFYRVMKGIYQFTANLLSYIPTKYYWNRSTSDLVIVKSKRVNFFLKHSVVVSTLCVKKTGPLRLLWHNFTNSQRSLIIFDRERPYSSLNSTS